MRGKYLEVYREIFGESPPDAAGVPSGDVVVAETRVGAKVPRAVSDFYRLVGREPSLMETHNRILPLSEVTMVDGRLVFIEENQGVCVWGIKPDGGDDPEVEQGITGDGYEWNSEEQTCSRFLCLMMYLQAAWGGHAHCADHMEPDELLPELRREWKQVVDDNGLLILQRPGLLVTYLYGSGYLIGAAREEAGLEALMRDYGFSPQ